MQKETDNRNLTIGVLSITAAIFFVGLLIVMTSGNPAAMAIGQSDRGGDYIMVTGQYTSNTELVYVVDAAAKRMNAYSYETSTRDFVLWHTVDLSQLAASHERKPQGR